MDLESILRRQSRMEAERGNFENLWEEVGQRLFPQKDDFKTKYSPGIQRNSRQYDSFPQLALGRFAAAMESGLTPRTVKWHNLSTGDPQLDDDDEVRLYLEALNEILWRNRYLPRNNFASQNHETLISGGAFGTGVMFIEENPLGGTRYLAPHLSQIFLSQNAGGMIDTVHRKFEITARNVIKVFNRDDDKVPEKAMKAMEDGQPDMKMEVLHVVMPNEEYDPAMLDRQGKPFSDLYVDMRTKEIIRKDGYHEFPYAIDRHVVSPNEVFGRGPGTMLLPDIKMLNEMKRTDIEARQMAVDPPLLLHDDGILGEFRLMPGARNYGAVDDQGRQLAHPFQNGAQLQESMVGIQDVRSQIDDAFLGVYFRVLLENPSMTATQALLIAQQQGQMTAPVVGRKQTEYLGPMIKRESGILFRQGRHPPVPQRIADALAERGEPLSIEYDSPMTRAAQAEEGIALQRSLEGLAPWAQIVGPEVYAKFNPEKVSEIICRVNGVPQEALYTDAEMEAIEEQKAAQQAIQLALQAAPVAAQAAQAMEQGQREAGVSPLPAAVA